MQSRVKKNTYLVSIGQIAKMSLALLLFPFATRYLGPDGFANYALASTVMYFIFLFNDLGMNTYLTREVSKDTGKSNIYFSNVLTIKLSFILIDGLLLFLFLVVLNFSVEANIAILIFAIYGVSTSFFELNASIYRAHERMEYETLYTILEKAITTLAGIYVLVTGQGLFMFCWVFVIGGFISILISTYFARKYFVEIKLSFDYNFAKEIIRKSMPFGASLFLANIYYSMGIVLISKMQPSSIAALFLTPAKLLKFTNIIPMILSIAIFPALSREFIKSKEKFAELFTKGFKVTFFLAIPLIAGIYLLSDKIALTVFGDEYLESIAVLRIVAFAAGLVYFNIFLAVVYNAANYQKLLVIIQLLATALNLIINLILIPKFAHIGAAISMLLTELIIFIICFVFAIIKIVRLQEILFIFKTLLSVTVMSVLIVLIKDQNLFIIFSLSVVVYFLSLYLLRGFTLSDVLFFKNLKMNSTSQEK